MKWIKLSEQMPPENTYLLFYFNDECGKFPIESGYFMEGYITISSQSISITSLYKSKVYWQEVMPSPKD